SIGVRVSLLCRCCSLSLHVLSCLHVFFFFSFNAPPTTEIYTLSLHDALPIWLIRAEKSDASRFHSFLFLVGDGRGKQPLAGELPDRKSTRLNSSHSQISYAVFCLKKKKQTFHTRFEPTW